MKFARRIAVATATATLAVSASLATTPAIASAQPTADLLLARSPKIPPPRATTASPSCSPRWGPVPKARTISTVSRRRSIHARWYSYTEPGRE